MSHAKLKVFILGLVLASILGTLAWITFVPASNQSPPVSRPAG